jgi:uncharacterized protein (DUF934 family)
MPLIKNGQTTENTWTFLADGVDAREVKAPGGITVSLGQYWASREALAGSNTPIGVRLQPDDTVEELQNELAALPLIEISFPRYTDGRGYSQAQLLRRRLQYRGEIRAVGNVLRDQIFYMHRSGFDAFDVGAADVAGFLESLGEITEAYQPAANGDVAIFQKRDGKG